MYFSGDTIPHYYILIMDSFDFAEIGETFTFVARCKKCGHVLTLTLYEDDMPEVAAKQTAELLKEHRKECK